jgi:hypothetical protein
MERCGTIRGVNHGRLSRESAKRFLEAFPLTPGGRRVRFSSNEVCEGTLPAGSVLKEGTDVRERGMIIPTYAGSAHAGIDFYMKRP